MLTRWISREKAVVHLRRAFEIAPDNTNNMYFLAEALLAAQPPRPEEARLLLELCATAPPRHDLLVEDAHYAEQARQLLADAFDPVGAVSGSAKR